MAPNDLLMSLVARNGIDHQGGNTKDRNKDYSNNIEDIHEG